MLQQFTQLPLPNILLENLTRQGFVDMTPVQAESLPMMLTGKDLQVQAPTGSGKTLAFALGIMNRLNPESYHTQALVLCPTRELSEQVADTIRRCAAAFSNIKVMSLFGGVAIHQQLASLKQGAAIVTGTPGRLRDLIDRGGLSLSEISVLVLDEADRMLEMGFRDDVDAIIRVCAKAKQTLLFSATMPNSIRQLGAHIQNHPILIQAESVDCFEHIEQTFFKIQPHQRQKACAALLSHYQPASAFVFCNTRQDCRDVCSSLNQMGFVVESLQGEMEQLQRTLALEKFANGSTHIMVATDVAARGLDIKAVDLVINYQLAVDVTTHIHRIGRTGRAGLTGLAVSLWAEQERKQLASIEEKMQRSLKIKGIEAVRFHANRIIKPVWQTLCLHGGKKAKISATDILGVLTQQAKISADDVGKIRVTASHSYVAIKIRSVKRALTHFREGRIKGKKIKAVKG